MGHRRQARDPNEAAHGTIRHVMGMSDEPPAAKNPAAVELGRLGGLKGGRVRAERLSSERRVEIARQAARARWTARNE